MTIEEIKQHRWFQLYTPSFEEVQKEMEKMKELNGYP